MKEVRMFEGLRALPMTEENPERIIEGYVAKYNKETIINEPLGRQIREIILPGAFDEFMQRFAKGEAHIPLLLHHDGSRVLAKTKHNTLKLTTDDVGLHIRASLSNSPLGLGTYQDVDHGNIDGGSFKFGKGSLGYIQNGIRYLHKINLDEVTLTGRPAYDDTHIAVALRAYQEYDEEIELLTKQTELIERAKKLISS